jgi:hypothetical protein
MLKLCKFHYKLLCHHKTSCKGLSHRVKYVNGSSKLHTLHKNITNLTPDENLYQNCRYLNFVRGMGFILVLPTVFNYNSSFVSLHRKSTFLDTVLIYRSRNLYLL